MRFYPFTYSTVHYTMLLYSGMVFTDSKGRESQTVKLSTSGQNISFNPSTPMDIQDRISIQDK